MKPHEFDHHLRSTLGEYQSHIDAQAVWTGVQAKMGAGPNRGGAFWWSTAGLVLLIGAGIIWYAQVHKAAPQQGAIAPTDSPLGLTANGSVEQQTAEAETILEVYEAEPVSTEVASFKDEGALSTTSNEIITTPPFPEGENMVHSSNHHRATGQMVVPSEIVKNNIADELSEGSSAVASLSDHSSMLTSDIIQTPQFRSVALVPGANETTLMPMPLLPPTSFEPVWGEVHFAHMGSVYFPKRATRRYTLALLADAGVGAAGRQLEATTPLWNDYADQRRSTESPLEFVAAQVRMSLQLHSGWYFTAGVSLTQVHERFAIDRTRSEDLLVTYISEIYIDEGGDSTFTYGTGINTHTRNEQFNHINRYTMLDIPLTAGYSHHFGAWSLGVETGVLVNVGLKSTGTMLNQELTVLRIEDSEMYRSRIGLSYTASLRLGYHVGSRTMLYLQPGLRYIPGLTDGEIHRQTYVLYGVNAGVAYRLW